MQLTTEIQNNKAKPTELKGERQIHNYDYRLHNCYFKTCACIGFNSNHSKLETIKMFSNRWMDKQTAPKVHNGQQ